MCADWCVTVVDWRALLARAVVDWFASKKRKRQLLWPVSDFRPCVCISVLVNLCAEYRALWSVGARFGAIADIRPCLRI